MARTRERQTWTLPGGKQRAGRYFFPSLSGRGALLVAAWVLLAPAPSAGAAELTADDAVRAALEHDPAYVGAAQAVEAARGEVRASGFLRANPTVSAEVSLVTDRATAAVSQPISISGEGWMAARGARLRLDAAEARLHRAALEAAAAARQSWAGAVAAAEHTRIAATAFEDAGHRRDAIEARARAGDVAPLDVRMARLEEASAAQALVSAQTEEAQARAGLARLVQGPAFDLPSDPLLCAPPASPSQAAATRADVVAADLDAAAARAAVGQSRSAVLPPVEVGAFVERDGGSLAAGPTLALALPAWHGNPAGIAASLADSARLTAEAAALRSMAASEAAGTTEALQAADRVVRRVGDGAPGEARAALAAIDQSTSAGELDLATAALLRRQVLDGWHAAVALREAVAEARIAYLLAHDDPALLPADLREASP